MELVNQKKDSGEAGGLRLVAEQKTDEVRAEPEKQFVNFSFYRVNPEWRKLDPETKSIFKSEFSRVFEKYRDEFLLFSYSLVGFDPNADLMFWRIGRSMDTIQDMTAALYRTRLGSYLEVADNYLAVTRKMMFVENTGAASVSEDRRYVKAGTGKYHFVYPCVKNSDWYEKTGEERDALIEENFMVGRRFGNIKIHMTHAFGFSGKEYIISFETDEPRDFLALAEELRQAPASKFTMNDMAIYTCRRRSLKECLDALG